jgi:predicted ATPase/DNA-binding Xre family transcriptional regulator
MALGQHLRELRATRKLSQRQVARQVGIDVSYLSKLENGHQSAREDVLRKLAKVLGAEPDGLLTLVPERRNGIRTAPLQGDVLLDSSAPPPIYRTRFIDRKEDMEQLKGLLLPERTEAVARDVLVSVTGPPGCGKTRLVAELANRIGARRPVRWHTVREGEPDAIRAAAEDLQANHVLVLDDAERDLETCTMAARRLGKGIAVVATSRRPLPVYGQHHLRLRTMPVPDRHQRPAQGEGAAPDLSRLQEQASVELFVDRARLARPGFQLDSSNAAAVFDVCRWLDGLPLAIELAALRLSQMAVADLAARTSELLAWLSGNTLDVPDRHASLTAAIEWSFEQLDQRQRVVAARLSMFASSFSLSDALPVAVDGQHDRDFVQATVMELVNRSLLDWREDADGRAFYRWLHPIRQYARRRLDADEKDSEETLDRYQKWVRQVVDTLDQNLPRRESEWERLAELTPELVSAVYELPPAEQADAMNRMTDALSKTLQFGNFAEPVSWFSERFSDRSVGGSQVFRQAGMVARVGGELHEAQEHFAQAYRIALNNRDQAAEANAALDLAENAADLADYGQAEEYVSKAEALYEKLEDDRGRIEVLNLRGKLAQERADLGLAEDLFNKALELARQVGDRRLLAYSLHSLGVCEHLLRRVTAARNYLKESLRIRSSMRNQRGVARVVEALALVESTVENHELVLRLLGAARQYRRSNSVRRIPPWWQTQLDAAEQEARASLVLRPELVERFLQIGAATNVARAGELATEITGALPEPPLGNPVTEEPLRRAISMPYVPRDELAGDLAAAARNQALTALDKASLELVESGAPAADAYRRLHKARLLALAEPIGSQTSDLLCFAINPQRYRGVVVPVFVSGRALAEALARHREWETRPVVEIRLEQLRANLSPIETVVVNPWTDHEFHLTATELAYPGSGESSDSMAAPTPASRLASSS